MKKIWLIMLSIILVVGLVFIGCKNEPDDPDDKNGPVIPPVTEKVTIKFNAGTNGIIVENGLFFIDVVINKGGTVTAPAASRDGYFVSEWKDLDGVALTPTRTHNVDTTYNAVWEDLFEVAESWDFDTPTVIENGEINSWDITGADLTTIKNAPAGSMLRLHFETTNYDEREYPNNWPVGSIGTATSAADADIVGLRSPVTGTEEEYTIYVEVSWVLDILGASGKKLTVFVPVQEAADKPYDMLTKVELLKPKQPRGTIPARPGLPAGPTSPLPVTDAQDPYYELVSVINFSFGYFGDKSLGKGSVAGTELDKITNLIGELKTADKDGVLRIYVRNEHPDAHRNTWGIGTVLGDGVIPKHEFRLATLPAGGEGYVDYPLFGDPATGIEELLGADDELEFDIYNQCVITRLEIRKQKDGVVIPKNKGTVITIGDDKVTVPAADMGSRRGNVYSLYDEDGNLIGYEFTEKAEGARGSYAWFKVDLGSQKLSDFAKITFTYEARGGDGGGSTGSAPDSHSRRVALLASADAFGAAAHASHANNSSTTGYLAANQVTKPMADAVTYTTAGLLELEMDFVSNSDYAALANLTGEVYFCIYEHTSGTAVFKVSDITFVEREADDNDDIIAALEAVESATYTAAQDKVSSKEEAKTAVEAIINTLPLLGVDAEVIDGTVFEQATAGTVGSPKGTNGKYTFTVKLSKGDGTPLTTEEPLTLTIIATEYIAPGTVFFSLADWFETNPTIETISGDSTNTSTAPIPLSRSSSGTTTTIVTGTTGKEINIRYQQGTGGTDSGNTHGLNIHIDNTGLDLTPNTHLYELKVTGYVVDTPPEGGRALRARNRAGTTTYGTSNTFITANDTITIDSELPVGTANDLIRIQLNEALPNATQLNVRITSIEIVYQGPRE